MPATATRSRICRTLTCCALGAALPALGTARSAGMPALPPLQGTASAAAPANPESFIFFVVGDDRPAKETDPLTPTIQTIYQQVAQAKPAFVLMLGDTVYGKDDKNEAQVAQEYAAFLKLAASGGVPVYNAPGNHEMDDKHDIPSATMESWYEKDTGSVPYGAFNYGNSRFIALDTDDVSAGCGGTPSAKDKNYAGNLGNDQLAALAADLDGDGSFAHVFVLMHRPIHADKSKSRLTKACRTALEQLFAQHANVQFVLASHEHTFYQAKAKPGAPTYLVSGGAGAPLVKGGYYNYLVFTVAGGTVTWKVVKP